MDLNRVDGKLKNKLGLKIARIITGDLSTLRGVHLISFTSFHRYKC